MVWLGEKTEPNFWLPYLNPDNMCAVEHQTFCEGGRKGQTAATETFRSHPDPGQAYFNSIKETNNLSKSILSSPDTIPHQQNIG